MDIQLPQDNGAAITESILAGNGRCMSNGSLKDDFGTSAFIALTKNSDDTYKGKNSVLGQDDKQSSFQSELRRLLGNTILMNAICALHNITEPCEMTIGCNNEAAL